MVRALPWPAERPVRSFFRQSDHAIIAGTGPSRALFRGASAGMMLGYGLPCAQGDRARRRSPDIPGPPTPAPVAHDQAGQNHRAGEFQVSDPACNWRTSLTNRLVLSKGFPAQRPDLQAGQARFSEVASTLTVTGFRANWSAACCSQPSAVNRLFGPNLGRRFFRPGQFLICQVRS